MMCSPDEKSSIAACVDRATARRGQALLFWLGPFLLVAISMLRGSSLSVLASLAYASGWLLGIALPVHSWQLSIAERRRLIVSVPSTTRVPSVAPSAVPR